MPISKEYLLEQAIQSERARCHAVVHLHIGIYTKTPGIANWDNVNLGKPTIIYDLNDEPLFFDFPVLTIRAKRIGMVRASANRVLGVGAMATYVGGPAWDIATATKRARAIVQRKYQAEIVGIKVVCYAYPKLGIAVTWSTKGREIGRTIIDVGDFSIVPETVEPDVRGPGAWSLYDHMPQEAAPRAVERFRFYDTLLEDLQERTGLSLKDMILPQQFSWIQSRLPQIIPFYTMAHLNLNLHAQENNKWCTVATGQMILEFHGYNYTQAQIATDMGAISGGIPTGTSWAGEETGLESLTNNTYDAEIDLQPSFGKAKHEINAQQPFDYSYPKHSMACAGYRQQNICVVGTQPEYSLELYDPWPPNVGTIRWEAWGAASVEGFVYLRKVP
jgi:hypothetical protein